MIPCKYNGVYRVYVARLFLVVRFVLSRCVLALEPIYQLIYELPFWLRNAAKIATHYLKSVALICRIPTKFYGDSRIIASDAFS